jgi:ribose transport system substrate-binding protein
MRWIMTCLLAGMFLFACVGCDSDEPAGGGASNDTSLEDLTIAVSIPAADHGWTGGVVWWARQAMDLHPEVNWVFQTATNPENQISQVRSMMDQQKLDGLVILAIESSPLTQVCAEAAGKGIYLVNVDRGLTKPVADVFLEGDNEAFGVKAAAFIAARLNGKGKIVILRGIPSTVDEDRYRGAMSVFEKYPDIEILGAQPGRWSRDKAMQVMQTFLTQHKQIDAVWAADDDMAEGAEQAIREAGRTGEMWLVGGGGKKTIVKRIMEGDPMIPATVTYPPSMIAAGIHMAVSNLRDGQADKVSQFMPRHIKLDVELVTPDNAERFYFPESVY